MVSKLKYLDRCFIDMKNNIAQAIIAYYKINILHKQPLLEITNGILACYIELKYLNQGQLASMPLKSNEGL